MIGFPTINPQPALLASSAPEQGALAQLLQYLSSIDYRFVTPTPATHARVIGRDPERLATKPEEVLGWSRPFLAGSIDPALERILANANVIERENYQLCRARIRVSSLHGHLFIHSAFPTIADDAVFLGPDSYRFADLIRTELTDNPPASGSIILDIGAGAGVGAIVAADLSPQGRVIMTDLNRQALRLAIINAAHAGHAIEARHGRDLAGHVGGVDIAFANPPYIIDPAGRTYRDGGGLLGAEIAITMTRSALEALRPGGRFILYTGSAIASGTDGLKAELIRLANEHLLALRYRELDPDVFGEELDCPGYETVDRIAVVAATFSPSGSV